MSHDARAQRVLSSVRLKVTLTLFILVVVLGVSGLTFVLVSQVFGQFDAATREDLDWKALQATREIARAADLGITLSDRAVVLGAIGEYRTHTDVERVVVMTHSGKVLLDHARRQVRPGAEELFRGPPGMVHEGQTSVWSWANASIEGNVVGRVAVVISLERLKAADRFRRKVLVLVAGGGVAAVFLSLFFVSFYLGPLLRLTERTMLALQQLNATLEHRVEERTVELREANQRLQASLQEIQSMQRELIDASRRAGMADVATAVLHNVGNVLNSVNVAAGVLADRVRQSRLGGLAKVVALINDQPDPGRFFSEDPRGRRLPAYFQALAETAVEERQGLLQELESLQKNVDHIKVIVARQQAHAKSTVGMVETVALGELVDDAVAITGASAGRAAVAVRCELAPLPPVRLDRHKLFQILTNLLSNARHAVDERQDAAGEHAITVRAAPGAGDRLVIEVEDTGSGIAPENLARIFTHGFTTKKDGHGFGLHSSALAALEMGGSLEAHSAGTGRGARFVLQLPLVAAERRGEEASGARPERSAEHTADVADSRSVPASRP